MSPRAFSEDTIAAIATPPGTGGLGVVRLSGPQALAVADALFRTRRPLTDAPSHTLHHGYLYDGDAPLDEAVAGLFRAPHSYTGEDVVEFSCHGGALLLRRVLDACLKNGARLAGPGEFTRRAYLNGKMDLTQAEAVADLIAARSEPLHRAGVAQLRGGLSRRLAPFRERLVHLLAKLEASLDFVEDEVPDLPREKCQKQIESLEMDLEALLATRARGKLLREGLRVALAGRPNAGKSSLFNALLGEQRAIVTHHPGTTRDTLEEQWVAHGVPVVLTDTAGLRSTARTIEKEGIVRARDALARADVVLGVVDAARRPDAADRRLARSLDPAKVLWVLAKADTVPPDERADSFEAWAKPLRWARPGVFVSSRTGEGLDLLRERLSAWNDTAEDKVRERAEDDVLINARQNALCQNARDALRRARAEEAPAEVTALELRRALADLNAVTGRDGEDPSEEVLDAIFSTFCIGK